MALKKFPPAPTFPPLLRLASLQDVPRMAVVSTLGFRESEIFKFERPKYEQFPKDTLAWFRNFFRDQISDPNSVVVLAEDEKLPDEEEDPPSEGQDKATNSKDNIGRVVVGVCSWVLENGSARKGQFNCPDLGPREPAPNRDLNSHRLRLVNEIKEAGERKYFTGMSICDKLVVHPAYWRRGHGSALIGWGKHLSTIDGVCQGVMPSHMSEEVFSNLGYQQIGTLYVEGDKEAEGFDIAVAVYDPTK